MKSTVNDLNTNILLLYYMISSVLKPSIIFSMLHDYMIVTVTGVISLLHMISHYFF